MPTRLRKYVAPKALTQPFVVLAQQIKVDGKTVRNFVAEVLPSLESKYLVETPRVLGNDEVHS